MRITIPRRYFLLLTSDNFPLSRPNPLAPNSLTYARFWPKAGIPPSRHTLLLGHLTFLTFASALHGPDSSVDISDLLQRHALLGQFRGFGVQPITKTDDQIPHDRGGLLGSSR